MSFAPLLGSDSPSYTFLRSSISTHLTSLATLGSSILTATLTLIDDFATRIPPSWCLPCWLTSLRKPNTDTKTARRESDPSTESFTLRKLEDTDGDSTRTALVFDPSTEIYTLKKLQDIDVEKAIFRGTLPSSAKSVKVQLPGETRLLKEVLGNETPTSRRLKHKPSLVDGIFIIPGRVGTRTTISTNEDQLPAELPATHGSLKRKHHQQQQQQSPVELPADEFSLVLPRAVLPTPPQLLIPRPRSPS